MDVLLNELLESPLLAFTVLLLATLTIPPLFERLRLPGLVGLLVAGVLLGPNLLGILDPNGETEKLLSDIGKIYLMFVAGLEIDLREFRRTRNRSLGFGLTTFLVPLVFGIGIGRVFGYGWAGAVLIGSLLSSHTLLAYPIVMRLGVSKQESVTVAVGATIFTDIGALLILAMCVAAQAGDFSAQTLVGQVALLMVYAAAVLFGLDWAGKAYFRRTGDEEGNQFLFVLLAVFLSAVGAQLINVDKIVGAFLAGLAVNDVLGEGPLKEKVEFVGSVLFIPFFFVCMGLYLDGSAFLSALTENINLTSSIVAALLASKFLAALIVKPLYRYSWAECLTMWSLSLPQVAATLAAALVGLQTGLISPQVFNAVIVLMLVTSVMGPLLTRRFASRLTSMDVPSVEHPVDGISDGEEGIEDPISPVPFSVLVPVSNPLTQRNLIEMAALIAHQASGHIVPLYIARAHVHMDEPGLTQAIAQGRKRLQKATNLSESYGTQAYPLLRVDDDIAEGITRAAREQDVNLVVMGWSPVQGLRARLFGTLIDSVVWSAHCPVVVTRLLTEPMEIRSVLVPVKNLMPQAVRTIRFAQLFASTHNARLVLLHVCDSRFSADDRATVEADLAELLSKDLQVNYDIKIIPHDLPAQVILQEAQQFDMVILRSMRRRTAGGLAVSDVTHEVLDGLTCSVVLFGEPHT